MVKYQKIQCLPPPTIKDYKIAAKKNLQLTKSLMKRKQPDYRWIIGLLFYSAMNIVNAMLVKNNIRPRGHRKTKERIRNHLSQTYPRLHGKYEYLHKKSEYARYCPSISLEWSKSGSLRDKTRIIVNDNLNYFEDLYKQIE